MTPFTILDGTAIFLDRANVDTDQIIPSRFLRRPRSDGYDRFLFHDIKQEDPSFPLNHATPRILVAGDNFGCGSSREGAVYALVDAGITCVIASSFGDIFAGNARKNGLLALRLPDAQMNALRAGLPGHLIVDLPEQKLHLEDQSVVGFEIDPFQKRCLVEGLDEIGITLSLGQDISKFCAKDKVLRPWAQPA